MRLLSVTLAFGCALPTVSAQTGGTYRVFGTGCLSTAGMPTISAAGNHRIGGNTTVTVRNLPRNQPAVLYFGISNRRWLAGPLPFDLTRFGIQGCTQFVSTEIQIPARSNAIGIYAQRFNHPNQLKFVGATLFNQLVVLDPAVRRSIRVSLSNAGQLIVGCGDGPRSNVNAGFNVNLPAIPWPIGFPGFRAGASITGQKWDRCCRTAGQRRCYYTGTGTITGGLPSGWFIPAGPIGSFLQLVNDKVCEPIRAITLGTISCESSLGLKFDQLNMSGRFSVSKDSCTNTASYSGSGNLTFGKGITGGGNAKLRICLPPAGPCASFGATLTATGNPVGTWRMSGRTLTMNIRVPNIKITASVLVPLINRRVGINFTIPTTVLNFTTPGIPLPAIPLPNCN